MIKNGNKRVSFKQTGTPGVWEAFVEGKRIAVIFQSSDRKFWYVDPVYELAADICAYADTLTELKHLVREAIEDHDGPDVWRLR